MELKIRMFFSSVVEYGNNAGKCVVLKIKLSDCSLACLALRRKMIEDVTDCL